jgi:predicted nucleic acid-binding protein
MLTVDSNVWIAAGDPTDRFHAASREFLTAAVDDQRTFILPAFAWVEIACALARRLRNAQLGVRAANAVLALPRVQSVPTDESMLLHALEVGPRLMVRGADALFASVAVQHKSILISWDKELVQRAGALTPLEWLQRYT